MPTVIVVGATSGLGLEIRNSLRMNGFRVVSISRRSLDDPEHFSCDITNFLALKQVYSALLKSNAKIYGLINCAGIASMNLALTTPDSVTERILAVNLQGTIFSNQIFAPLLIRNGGGRIINFSTIAVHLGLAGESVYVASKAGVEGFSRSFANEMAKFDITVNCIAPGPIKTNLLKGITDQQIKDIVNRQIIKKVMNPSDVSNLVNLLLSESSENLTGQVLSLGGV
jgi:3-oxoacyl-[acyl-carrier protein] reductase